MKYSELKRAITPSKMVKSQSCHEIQFSIWQLARICFYNVGGAARTNVCDEHRQTDRQDNNTVYPP